MCGYWQDRMLKHVQVNLKGVEHTETGSLLNGETLLTYCSSFEFCHVRDVSGDVPGH